MHRCKWNGCHRTIASTLYMCAEHWFRLPRALRNELWDGYRRGITSNQYVAADEQIQDWVALHHPEPISKEQ